MASAAADTAPALPAIRADLQLHWGAPDDDGSPMWMLFDPLRARYFHLHVRGLRVLRHWRAGASPEAVAAAAIGHGVQVDTEDVEGMARFLLANDLTEARGPADTARLQGQAARSRTSWYQWLLHRYLFIRIPLVRPDPFLARHLQRVRFLGGRTVRRLVLVLGVLGIVLALRQLDVFVATFVRFLDWQGVVWFGLALVFVKTAHELAHAFVARHHGCRVAAMGIAFLVLVPVLYTDATDMWRLARGRDRLAVDLAGVMTELAIASLATFAWSFLPPGGLRDATFFLATTSWVTSVIVNLSPFMRFDGYHALSDLWGIHNLQPRAFELARWRLREALLGLNMPPPESFRPRRRRLLVLYAFGTWVYRLFLFLGIALLVYHFAFKALGILLFAVEIGWFITRPIVQEIAAMRHYRWSWNRKSVRTLVIIGLFGTALLVPWRSTLPLPAVLEAASHARVHAPASARVAEVAVVAGKRVEQGDVLVTLEKPKLAYQARKAVQRIELIRTRLDRRAGSHEDLAAVRVLRRRLVGQRTRLDDLRELQADLVVRSPVTGVIARLAELKPGQWLARAAFLAEVLGQDGVEIIGYVRGQDRARVELGATGRFISNDGAHEAVDVRVTAIEDVGTERLPQRMLASSHGGPLPVMPAEGSGEPRLEEGIYRVRMEPVAATDVPAWPVPGRASLEAQPESLAGRFLRYAASVLIRESGF